MPHCKATLSHLRDAHLPTRLLFSRGHVTTSDAITGRKRPLRATVFASRRLFIPSDPECMGGFHTNSCCWRVFSGFLKHLARHHRIYVQCQCTSCTATTQMRWRYETLPISPCVRSLDMLEVNRLYRHLGPLYNSKVNLVKCLASQANRESRNMSSAARTPPFRTGTAPKASWSSCNDRGLTLQQSISALSFARKSLCNDKKAFERSS